MEFDQELIDKWEILHDFKQKLIYENRYFLEHEALDLIKNIAEKNELFIKAGHTFFRARLYTQNDYINLSKTYEKIKKFESESTGNYSLKDSFMRLSDKRILNEQVSKIKSNFWGYPKGQNLMPPAQNISGRGNPPYIRYLYLADKPCTAMAEIRPTLQSKVSVAKITSQNDLNIVDLSWDAINIQEDMFLYLIISEFTKPFSGESKQYIATQYIAEFLKHKGYDGLKYNSSLYESGRNFLFFKDSGFDDVETKLYEVTNICFESKCLNADYEPGVVHHNIHTNPFYFLENTWDTKEKETQREQFESFFKGCEIK